MLIGVIFIVLYMIPVCLIAALQIKHIKASNKVVILDAMDFNIAKDYAIISQYFNILEAIFSTIIFVFWVNFGFYALQEIFGRGLINVGGVNFDIDNEKIERAIKTFEKVEKDVERMVKTMLKNTSVMSRLEKTGTVNIEKAREIGLVGMAARACGLNLDSRFDFADECFKSLALPRKIFKGTGDVNSRFQLRYQETMESLSISKRILTMLKNPSKDELLAPCTNKVSANSLAISITEGWRGEVVHIALTDANSNLTRYKIKDPSFNNWYGLALAVRNNGVSDFPLCNKSFNLSYCGNDL